MATKKKSPVVEPVEITSTEIRITSNENLNFRNFKILKGEEIIISDQVLDKLVSEIPNLKTLISKGVLEIVK
jgi:hypothetical protein